MNSTLQKIEQLKKEGYDLDFARVFNHAFENYKKIALYVGLILLVLFILSFIVGGTGFVFYFGAENINQQFIENLANQQPTLINLLLFSSGATVISSLFSPLAAGFLKIADCADKDETLSIGTLFTYYRPEYFGRIFLATLIIGLINVVISVACNAAGIILVDTGFSIIISILTSLTIPLIIFGNLSVSDALSSSIALVNKHPLTILLLFIVGGIASVVGLIACCIGIVFTIPFTYSITYSIYREILSTDAEDSIDSIGESSF